MRSAPDINETAMTRLESHLKCHLTDIKRWQCSAFDMISENPEITEANKLDPLWLAVRFFWGNDRFSLRHLAEEAGVTFSLRNMEDFALNEIGMAHAAIQRCKLTAKDCAALWDEADESLVAIA